MKTTKQTSQETQGVSRENEAYKTLQNALKAEEELNESVNADETRAKLREEAKEPVKKKRVSESYTIRQVKAMNKKLLEEGMISRKDFETLEAIRVEMTKRWIGLDLL